MSSAYKKSHGGGGDGLLSIYLVYKDLLPGGCVRSVPRADRAPRPARNSWAQTIQLYTAIPQGRKYSHSRYICMDVSIRSKICTQLYKVSYKELIFSGTKRLCAPAFRSPCLKATLFIINLLEHPFSDIFIRLLQSGCSKIRATEI